MSLRRWHAVHTQINCEHKAAAHLVRQGFDVYLPVYGKKRRHARKVEVVRAPCFPRYLFVAIDVATQRWRTINSTVGVSRLVMWGDTPARVPDLVIEGLRSRHDANGNIMLLATAAKMRPGDAVRVVSGAFEACRGFFQALNDHERVSILLDLLGRKVRVVLPVDAIEGA